MVRQAICRIALVAAFTTSCATSDAIEDSQVETFPAAQAWALDDEVVTDEEYQVAVDRFSACVRDAGYQVTEPVTSPIDGLTLLYDLVPQGEPGAWNAAIERCNTAHISHIEPAYVEARQQLMEPSLRAATAECLQGKGVKLRGYERNVRDFMASAPAEASGNAVMECIQSSMEGLFPHMRVLIMARW